MKSKATFERESNAESVALTLTSVSSEMQSSTLIMKVKALPKGSDVIELSNPIVDDVEEEN